MYIPVWDFLVLIKNNMSQVKKVKNAVWSVGIIIVLLVVLVVISSPRSPVVNGEQAVVAGDNQFLVTETSYDFGAISMKNGMVERDFVLTNNGTSPITVTKLYTSCMCTKALLKVGDSQAGPFGMPGHAAIPSIRELVQPGEQATVRVIFDPNAHGPAGVGRIDRVVTVENNGGDPVELRFSALVTP